MAIDIAPLRIDTLLTEPVGVDMLRLDAIHPVVSGNKYFKLKYNIAAALEQGTSVLVSFGGAYSNHLHALAWAAQEYGIPSVGLVRGEPVNNPTLHDCRQWGMQLQFIPRSDYAHKHEADFLQAWRAQYPNAYFIPEGGDNALGLAGCETILDSIDLRTYEHVVCAVGTGTTFCGIARCLPPTCTAWGVPVFKHHEPVLNRLREQIPHTRWQWLAGYEDGGFGKYSSLLKDRVSAWERQWPLALDRVYTAKMMWAVTDSIAKGVFKPGERILTIHTGGLQGNRSME